MDIIIVIICVLLLALVFLRRWYLLEKGQLFGKMVFKKGMKLPQKITREDHEITVKDMIPPADSVDKKLVIKGDGLYKKAELALKRGHLLEAEKMLIQALAMNPAHIESHAKLGMIYLNQELYGKSELIFRRLVLAVPDEAAYFGNLGLSLFQQEKFQEAKEFYEKAIELDEKRAGRYYSLARINHALNDFDSAVLNIQKALTLDHDNLDYGLTLAHWYQEKGMFADAKVLLDEIIRHWPDNEEARNMLARSNEPLDAEM